MSLSATYTSGVIAAKDKYLLKDKILRFAEMTAQEAFRALVESGFGGGAEAAADVYSFESLIANEELSLDAFIREYAPSETDKAFLLAERDFHNAKALVKAKGLGVSAEKMLASEGLLALKTLETAVTEVDFSALSKYPELQTACEAALQAFAEGNATGAQIGTIFDKSLYAYLGRLTKFRPFLKKLLAKKADMTNVLTSIRLVERENAEEKYLPCGTLSSEKLALLWQEDTEAAAKAFADTPYAPFVKKCLEAKSKGLPLTGAEKLRDGLEADYFAARKYELKNSEPFLYYAYRRRVENANVRIVFVGLLAGLSEREIKERLRAF